MNAIKVFARKGFFYKQCIIVRHDTHNYPMKIVEYIKETRAELKHVSWLSRRQAMAYTILVIAVSLAVALFLGVFDYLFTAGLDRFIFTF